MTTTTWSRYCQQIRATMRDRDDAALLDFHRAWTSEMRDWIASDKDDHPLISSSRRISMIEAAFAEEFEKRKIHSP